MKIVKEGVLLLLIIGLALFMGSEVSAGKGQGSGKQLFIHFDCNACHTIKALHISLLRPKNPIERRQMRKSLRKLRREGRIPPDLSDIGNKHNAAWLNRWMEHKEKIDGKRHQEIFHGTAHEREVLAEWMGTLKYTRFYDKNLK
jgi:hypothetical protein